MMPIYLADIFGLFSFFPLNLIKESRVIVYCRAQYGSSSSLIYSNNTGQNFSPSQNSSEAFCLCLLTDTNVSHILGNANWFSASRRRCWSIDIMVSPVTVVIKSALRSQTLHYWKDEIKTKSSFSEDARFWNNAYVSTKYKSIGKSSYLCRSVLI